MTTSLVVFGPKTLCEIFCLAVRSCNLSCRPREFDDILDRPIDFHAVAFVLPGLEVAEVAYQLKTLRLDLSFRGQIVILSFVPDSLRSDKVHSKTLKLIECKVHALPVRIKDFCADLSSGNEVSPKELERIQQHLRIDRTLELATLIRHDYDNKLALSLTHLLSIAKYGQFKPPDLDKVRGEINQVRLNFSSEKLENFAIEVTRLETLAETSFKYKRLVDVDALLPRWKKLCETFERVDTTGSSKLLKDVSEQADVFRSDLKHLLESVTEIKAQCQHWLDENN